MRSPLVVSADLPRVASCGRVGGIYAVSIWRARLGTVEYCGNGFLLGHADSSSALSAVFSARILAIPGLRCHRVVYAQVSDPRRTACKSSRCLDLGRRGGNGKFNEQSTVRKLGNKWKYGRVFLMGSGSSPVRRGRNRGNLDYCVARVFLG